MPSRISTALLLACIAVCGGCVGTPRPASMPAGVAQAPDLPVAIFDRLGKPASYFDALDAALMGDVVLIGETHGHPVGLEFAARLFEDILESRPDAALSMEFYERDLQGALDDYLAGVTDDEAFKAAAKRTKGNDPPGHRRMVEAARQAGAPVIAANAPRRYVTISRTEGYDRLTGLTAEQRRLFTIPAQMPAGAYRENYDELMGSMMASGAHGDPVPPDEIPARLDAGFRSQSLWDATMADSIDRALDHSNPVVHVIGRFHSDFEGGTFQLLRQHRPRARIITLSFIDREPGPLDPEDLGRADFVIYSAKPPEEPDPEGDAEDDSNGDPGDDSDGDPEGDSDGDDQADELPTQEQSEADGDGSDQTGA